MSPADVVVGMDAAFEAEHTADEMVEPAVAAGVVVGVDAVGEATVVADVAVVGAAVVAVASVTAVWIRLWSTGRAAAAAPSAPDRVVELDAAVVGVVVPAAAGTAVVVDRGAVVVVLPLVGAT
jgi:hypothetical protein